MEPLYSLSQKVCYFSIKLPENLNLEFLVKYWNIVLQDSDIHLFHHSEKFLHQLLDNQRHKHFNNHLQSSYIKYGEEQFRYDIIETTSAEELLEKEVYWIKLLNANNNEYGYNKRLIVNSNLGIKLSEETRRKLSESHLGHKRSDESFSFPLSTLKLPK